MARFSPIRLATWCVTTLVALAATGAFAADAVDVFARFKAASGGERWDTVTTLRSIGTLQAGGLDGQVTSLQDLRTGRSADRYTLGPITGANGFDGANAWSQDPGGEVEKLDAVDAKQRARSQAWLGARGYWYAQRIAEATLTEPARRERDGRAHDVVVATPQGGDPLTLWFDAETHLLVRVEERDGAGTSVTTLGDYREASGVRVPFHVVGDTLDAQGHAEPRARTEVRYATVEVDAALDDAAFAMPEMAPTARIVADGGITRVRFDLVNHHIYADGAIDGKPARFLVDTGGANLLTPDAAKRFGLEGEGRIAGRGVGEEVVDVAFARAKELRLGDAVLDKPSFVVMSLGDLEAVEGVTFDGLVGYELFRRFGVTIDYAARTLELAEPERFVPPANAHAVPFVFNERIPIVQGTLDGVPGRFSLDTGSRVSLSLHSPFVREHGLVKRYAARDEGIMGWGVGGPSRGLPVRFGTLVLGDLAINGVAGDLYTGDKGAFATPDISGNLGGGVFKRFTLAFDYTKRTVYFAPNALFGQADAYDRSGLFLLGEGNALRIADVTAHSAGAKAGLRADDRILSIDGETIATRTLDAWRTLLRETPTGTRLKIEVARAGAVTTRELVLADRIPAKAAKKPVR